MVKEDLNKLLRHRAFLFPSSEIYGGISGLYDFGHNGTKVRKKLTDLWRKFFLSLNQNFYEIETSNILPREVLESSGHVENFTDPFTKCKKCGLLERADHILESQLNKSFEGLTEKKLTGFIKKYNVKCPECGGQLESVGTVNLMFPLNIGAVYGKEGFLRPETAQGAYLNFLREYQSLRKKLPLGLGIIGRAYRNEISPRQGVYRMREFSQAELQIFFDPDEIKSHPDFKQIENYRLILKRVGKNRKEMKCKEVVNKNILPKFYVYYLAKTQEFFLDVLQIPKEKFRIKELSEDEKAFYNKFHWDIQLDVESYGGFGEVGGVHYRTDHDLKGHEKGSKKKHRIKNEKEFIPHVLEISLGLDRLFFAILELSFKQEDKRNYLNLPNKIAPTEVCILPLVNKDGIPERAREIYRKVRDFDVFYDEKGSIGKRYRRAEEIGTPYCITCDYDTLKDDTVTIRESKSMEQIRVKTKNLPNALRDLITNKKEFKEVS